VGVTAAAVVVVVVVVVVVLLPLLYATQKKKLCIQHSQGFSQYLYLLKRCNLSSGQKGVCLRSSFFQSSDF
jgi:hypothetical protein